MTRTLMTTDATHSMPQWLSAKDGCSLLRLKVTPRASASGIIECGGERLRVRLKAPPVDGRANREIIAFLAALLKIPQSRVAISAGGGSRLKSVSVSGVAPEKILERVACAAER
jgi:uncharacterized protein